ncbi:MAG: ArnT family glycosyltransferase [Polyangiales bacterium]
MLSNRDLERSSARRAQRLVRDVARGGGAHFLTAAAVVLAASAHGYFLFYRALPLAMDEGYMGAFAQRLLAGRFLPYVDAVSQRGPLLYWSVAAFQALFGPSRWIGIRVLALVANVVTLLACSYAGVAARRPLVGAIAAAAYAAGTCLWLAPYHAIALNGEAIAAPFCMLAIGFAVSACEGPEERRVRQAAIAGLCAGLAALSKQTSLLLVPALLVTLLGWSHGPRKLATTLALAAGATLPVLLLVVRYAIAGELSALWYWTVTYNRGIYMAPFAQANGLALTLDFMRGAHRELILASGLVGVVVLARTAGMRLRRQSVQAGESIAACALLAVPALAFGALATLRFWDHYFVIVLAPLGLLWGCAIDAALPAPPAEAVTPDDRRHPTKIGHWVVGAGLAGLLLVGAVRLWHERRGEEGHGFGPPLDPAPACAIVDKYSRPGDRMFVWGFDSDLNVTCNRVPASRFVFSVYLAGVVPPFWHDVRHAYVVPDGPKELLRDLQRSDPQLILDLPKIFDGLSVTAIDEVGPWVRSHYDAAEQITTRDGRTINFLVKRHAPR